MPCPLELDAKDLRREMTVPNKELSQASKAFKFLQSMCGVGEEGWVRTEDYDFTVDFLKKRREEALAGAESAEEREEIMVQRSLAMGRYG